MHLGDSTATEAQNHVFHDGCRLRVARGGPGGCFSFSLLDHAFGEGESLLISSQIELRIFDTGLEQVKRQSRKDGLEFGIVVKCR